MFCSNEYPQKIEGAIIDVQTRKCLLKYVLGDSIVFFDYKGNVNTKHGEKEGCETLNKKISLNENSSTESTEIENSGDVVTVIESEKNVSVGRITENCQSVANEIIFFVGDVLFSKAFTAEKYDVYKSINGKFLQIVPSSKGNIVCKDNLIFVKGLDDLLHGKEIASLEYECKNGVFLIKLEA